MAETGSVRKTMHASWGKAMALVVPSMPRCRASGSPDVLKVRSRRTARPRATNICSPSDKFSSCGGGGKQTLIVVGTRRCEDGGREGAAREMLDAQSVQALHGNRDVASRAAEAQLEHG